MANVELVLHFELKIEPVEADGAVCYCCGDRCWLNQYRVFAVAIAFDGTHVVEVARCGPSIDACGACGELLQKGKEETRRPWDE